MLPIKNELIGKVETFKAKKKQLKEECKAFCQDKSIPLEERWHFFCHYAVDRKHEVWIQDFKSLQDANIQDTIYQTIERHEVTTVDDIMMWIEDQRDEYVALAKDYSKGLDEAIIAFKEEVIEKYLWSFEYDW